MTTKTHDQLGKKISAPHCADCGMTSPFPWRRTDMPDLEIFVWLCGSCAYLREHPDAARTPAKPRRPKYPQLETLFDPPR